MRKQFRSSVCAAVAALALVLVAPMAASASEVPNPDEETVTTTEVVIEPAPAEDQGSLGDESVVINDVVEEDVPSEPTAEEVLLIPALEEDIPSAPVIEDSVDSTSVDDSSSDKVINDLSETGAQPDEDIPWVPLAGLVLSGQACVSDAGASTELVFSYADAQDEAVYGVTLDGNLLPGDAGGFTVSAGVHEYSYSIMNLITFESVDRGPFFFTVEACDAPVIFVSPMAPTIDNIEYSIHVEDDPNFIFTLESGQVLTLGENVLGPIGSGVVIATPKDGVSVDPNATIQWPFDFTKDDGPQPPVFITPPAPTQVGNGVIIPSEEGVVYKDEDGNVVMDTVELTEDVCFTAEPSGDVPFDPAAQTSWCFTYTPVDVPPQACPAFHVENDKGKCEPVDDTVIIPSDGGTTNQPVDGDTKKSDDAPGLPKSGVTDKELPQTGANINITGLLATAGAFIVGGLLLTLRRWRSA